jgi:hypothetical protein
VLVSRLRGKHTKPGFVIMLTNRLLFIDTGSLQAGVCTGCASFKALAAQFTDVVCLW